MKHILLSEGRSGKEKESTAHLRNPGNEIWGYIELEVKGRYRRGKKAIGDFCEMLYKSFSCRQRNKAKPDSAYPVSWRQFEPHMESCCRYVNAL